MSIIAGCGTASTGSSSSTSGPPLNGKVSLFTLPLAGSSSTTIAARSDGNVWFTEVLATTNGPSSKIGRITPSGKISEFPPDALRGNLSSLAVGPDGNLWFTDGGFSQGGKVGYITPTGTIKQFSLPASSGDPVAITFGPDGNLWFTETTIEPKSINNPPPSGQIGRITPTGKISTYRLPSGGVPSVIVVGPDHNLWFPEEVAASNGPPVNKIGRITLTGTITEFTLPSGNAQGSMGLPVGITAGADGLWFTDAASNTIGRITTTGEINEFTFPTPQSLPENIVNVSNGTFWFTEQGVNSQTGKIGKLTIVT